MTSIAFQQEVALNKRATAAIGCSIFVILMVIGAYVRIPLFFTPVPITLQTFFVLLSGAMLGRRLGPASQAVYISLGVFGLPVFQGYGCGMAHIFGPTGGYLLGFIPASYIVGYLAKDINAEKGISRIFLAMITGLIVIYLLGVIWLKFFLGAGLPASLILGLYPFMPGEVLKVIAATYIYKGLRHRI